MLRDVLHPLSGRGADVKRLPLRAVVLIAAAVSVLGCSRRGDPQGDAAATAAQPQDVAAASPSAGSLPPNWQEARTDLPERNRGGLFQGREPAAPVRRRPPPPLTYVGKVTRDGESYAVLGREDRVYMVSVGDAVGNGYRVQSISEKEVVILNSDFGMTQTLRFSAAASSPAPPTQDVQAAQPEPQKDD